MAPIKRTITVMDLRNTTFYEKGKEFEITKLVNTISYEIGQEMSKSEVDRIIHGGRGSGGSTTVNIIPYKKG